MHQPTTTHLCAAKRILRYVKGTIDFGLFFQRVFKLYKVLVMQTGLDLQMTEDQLVVFVFSLVTILFHGVPRNNPQLQGQVHRQST